MYCQYQDDQLEQGNPLINNSGATRLKTRPDGGTMILRLISMENAGCDGEERQEAT